jgi:hypothetical protein
VAGVRRVQGPIPVGEPAWALRLGAVFVSAIGRL